jgi:hypothetical protein
MELEQLEEGGGVDGERGQQKLPSMGRQNLPCIAGCLPGLS